MQICYIKGEKYSPNEFLKKQAKRELDKIPDKTRRLKIACCMVTIALANINTLYAKTLDLEKYKANLDEKGNQMLSIIQSLGYWVAIIAAGVDIIKNVKKQDVTAILAIALRYATLFGLLYALPWIFELIKDLFSLE